MRIRRRHLEYIPWLILVICLVAIIGAAFYAFITDVERIRYDGSQHNIKCAHCSNTRYHVHQGIDQRHYGDY